jgi:hypothetical protein
MILQTPALLAVSNNTTTSRRHTPPRPAHTRTHTQTHTALSRSLVAPPPQRRRTTTLSVCLSVCLLREVIGLYCA